MCALWNSFFLSVPLSLLLSPSLFLYHSIFFCIIRLECEEGKRIKNISKLMYNICTSAECAPNRKKEPIQFRVSLYSSVYVFMCVFRFSGPLFSLFSFLLVCVCSSLMVFFLLYLMGQRPGKFFTVWDFGNTTYLSNWFFLEWLTIDHLVHTLATYVLVFSGTPASLNGEYRRW